MTPYWRSQLLSSPSTCRSGSEMANCETWSGRHGEVCRNGDQAASKDTMGAVHWPHLQPHRHAAGVRVVDASCRPMDGARSGRQDMELCGRSRELALFD